MKLVESINCELKRLVKEAGPVTIFGQNIDAGSYLGGLTRGLASVNSGLTLNTPNSENLLVGLGYGLMSADVPSIYFMKQTDFLCLAIDQLVNTHNIFQLRPPKTSFAIIPVCVDSGFEGPQSSLNNLDDIGAVSGIPIFSVATAFDVQNIFSRYLFAPGIKIIAISQQQLKKEIISSPGESLDGEERLVRYRRGKDVDVFCFNFAISYGLKLTEELRSEGIDSSLFSINPRAPTDVASLLSNWVPENDVAVFIDDGKSRSKSYQTVERFMLERGLKNRPIVLARSPSSKLLPPSEDRLCIDYRKEVSRIKAMIVRKKTCSG